jgi:hypothetical protein
MKKLLLIRARGLSADQAVRGDMAWNLSDLIADGSFAPFKDAPDLDAVGSGLAKDRVTVVDVPYRDAASFDASLGLLRTATSDAVIAIVSEAVFISQHYFREIKPGTQVAASEVPRLLEVMLT